MFGRFKNIQDFLDSYSRERKQKRMEYINSLSLEDQIAVLRNPQVTEIAEVKATIKEREADDVSTPKHYQMIITLNEIVQFSSDIKEDIEECEQNKWPVFVAIRYGDRLGINKPITQGMNNGDQLHLKGEWITKDKAYNHGGEKMSVLHFTHHPIGFTCTVEKCYS